MKPFYIHSNRSISAQNTFQEDDFLNHIISYNSNKIAAIYPNYKDYIAPIAARRMATGVKMGIAAAKEALADAQIGQPDAIIAGTGMGCIEDTETFLNAMIENDESFLTPTAFIQSTHNTVSAQIALNLSCKGYNNTFVQGGASFESAVLDAFLVLQNEARTVLLGGVDELGKEFIDHVQMMEAKEEQGIQVPFSEGAHFFVVSSEKDNSCIMVKDVDIFSSCDSQNIIQKLKSFLKQNGCEASDIDALVLGYNGDHFDSFYNAISQEGLQETLKITYKHLCGEYFTASAFGFWTACEILKRQKVPKAIIKQGKLRERYKNIVLYNQFKGHDHSFILLSAC